MLKACVLAQATLLCLFTTTASASIVLANFESGAFPLGWMVDPAWQVGEETNSSPNIEPADPLVSPFADGGDYFAFSGRPDTHPPNSGAEEGTGVVTSPALVVSYTMLEWLSVGWSNGPSSNSGENYFQILDFNKNAIGPKISTAQSDSWELTSINLLTEIGLSAGDTFYFQAVDGRNQSGFAWIGIDNLTLTGDQLVIPAGVPEATSFLTWGLIGLTFAAGGWKHRNRT